MKQDITPTDVQTARHKMSRRLFFTLLVFYAWGSLLLLAASIILNDSKIMVLTGINVLFALLAYLVQKKDRLQLAGACVSFGLLFTGFYASWTTTKGIEDSSIIVLPVSCMMAALLLSRPMLIAQLSIALIGTFLIGLRVQLDLFPDPELDYVPAMDVVLVAAVLFVVTLGLRRLINDLWATLGVAVSNEYKLRDSHQALLVQTDLVRQSEQRWRSLVDAAPDHILQLDNEGIIIFCNRPETPCGHAIGNPLASVVIDEDRGPLEEAIHATIHHGLPSQVECVSQIDEKTRTLTFHLGPMKDEDENNGAIVLVGDVTERHRLREQLLRSQKLDSLGRLAGGIAHDFNNLLTVICGHAELAEMRAGDDTELAEDLKVIRRTGDRAADLTQQILAFGRRQSLRLSPHRLHEVLKNMERLLSPLIGSNINLEVDADPTLPPVMADRSQIEQVVTNLVVNARDAIRSHTEQNPRKIRLATRLVAVDERMLDELLGLEPGDHVELMVSDTGTGMTRDVQDRLFEPFFTTKKPGEGTGLGLATVYGIVHQSKGAIRVYSEPGLGTSFKIYWPIAGREMAGGLPDEGVTAKVEIRGTEHVLLVEDDPAVLKLAHAALEDLGYRVSIAEDGEKALAMVQETDDLDIVVSDVVMPGMSGFDLAGELPSTMPIILTSGYAEDAWADNGRALIGEHFLQKPYGPSDLASAIRKRLDT